MSLERARQSWFAVCLRARANTENSSCDAFVFRMCWHRGVRVLARGLVYLLAVGCPLCTPDPCCMLSAGAAPAASAALQLLPQAAGRGALHACDRVPAAGGGGAGVGRAGGCGAGAGQGANQHGRCVRVGDRDTCVEGPAWQVRNGAGDRRLELFGCERERRAGVGAKGHEDGVHIGWRNGQGVPVCALALGYEAKLVASSSA